MQAVLALDWMNVHGRPVDQRCVAVELGEAAPSTIADALQAFQNSDGGFGHALEPDVRLAGSSVLATTIALQLLAQYGLDRPTDLLNGASRYLGSAYDADAAAWPIVSTDVSDAPHAPWWNYRPPSACLINPRAEILGYAYRWPGFVDGANLDRITAEVSEYVTSADSVEMHDLMVFNRLFTGPNLPSALDDLQDRFLDLARQTIPVSAVDWQGYALMPVTIIDNPLHPLAGEFAGPIEENIEFLWSLQTADGSWDPPWNWDGAHSETWPEAAKDIRSLVTARTIATLQRFNAFR
jgi:hypothetical protein